MKQSHETASKHHADASNHHRDAAGHFAENDTAAGKKSGEKARQSSKMAHEASDDLAPNFYPVLSSLRRLIMPCSAGCAKAMGA